MKEQRDRGRWVILAGDDTPPIFWSSVRDDLEDICEVLRRTCPSARVVWIGDAEDSREIPRQSPRGRNR